RAGAAEAAELRELLAAVERSGASRLSPSTSSWAATGDAEAPSTPWGRPSPSPAEAPHLAAGAPPWEGAAVLQRRLRDEEAAARAGAAEAAELRELLAAVERQGMERLRQLEGFEGRIAGLSEA
ncbi:unnamed protein product, partial [Prorocentrum cordatum]